MSLLRTLKAAWDASEVKDEFPGGLWLEEARPDELEFPYAILSGISNIPSLFHDGGGTKFVDFQVAVFYKISGSADPALATEELVAAIREFLGIVDLSYSGQSSLRLRWRRDVSPVPVKKSQGVWRGVTEYRILSGDAS